MKTNETIHNKILNAIGKNLAAIEKLNDIKEKFLAYSQTIIDINSIVIDDLEKIIREEENEKHIKRT